MSYVVIVPLTLSSQCRCSCRLYLFSGCEWYGQARVQGRHQQQCTILNESPRQILRYVNKRAREKRTSEMRAGALDRRCAQEKLCALLSKRHRDVAIKDVIIVRVSE